MTRITKADLDQLVVIIKTNTGNEGYVIEYASGRPRLYLDDDRGVREVSPRLPARELSYWLEGFIEGLTSSDNPPLDVVALNPGSDVRLVASPTANEDFPWGVAVDSLGGYRIWAAFRTEDEAIRHAEHLSENLKWDTEIFRYDDE